MKRRHLTLAILFLSMLILPATAQRTGQWGVAAGGAYALPLGSLTNWFNPATGGAIALGQQYNENWYIEGLLEYIRFDDENLSGYAAGRLELQLELTGLLVSGRYHLARGGMLRPYVNLAAGLYYWKGVRGEIAADSDVQPAVPYIPRRTLEEFNAGFRGGFGVESRLSANLSLDLLLAYRFVVGELWPTLQPNIDLEGVSGLQSVNLGVGVRWLF